MLTIIIIIHKTGIKENKAVSAVQSGKVVGPLQKILQNKAMNDKSSVKSDHKVVSSSKAPPFRKDPYLEQEEMELARLSKLLGIDKSENLILMLHSLQELTSICCNIYCCRCSAKESCVKIEQRV